MNKHVVSLFLMNLYEIPVLIFSSSPCPSPFASLHCLCESSVMRCWASLPHGAFPQPYQPLSSHHRNELSCVLNSLSVFSDSFLLCSAQIPFLRIFRPQIPKTGTAPSSTWTGNTVQPIFNHGSCLSITAISYIFRCLLNFPSSLDG